MIVMGRRMDPGYTALELLVVMAIIAMVFTSAIVYFHPFVKTARAKTAASDVEDLLMAARSGAITQRCDCTLQIITDPESSDFLGQTPLNMWRNAPFSSSYADVKPPRMSVGIYFSRKDAPGVPLDPANADDQNWLRDRQGNVFLKWFTSLPAGVSLMNVVNGSDEDINGIRIVFDKMGRITEVLTGTGKLCDKIDIKVFKIVESGLLEEPFDDVYTEFWYVLMTPEGGGISVMTGKQFDEYLKSDWDKDIAYVEQ